MFKILGIDGKEYGPVTQGNVIEWIRDGRANLQTKVRKGDDTEWRTLADFPEFVPTGTAPAFVAPPVLAEATPEPVAVVATLPLGGLRRRLSAAMIDGALQWLCWMPTSIAFNQIITDRMTDHEALSLVMLRSALADTIGKSLPFLIMLALVQAVLLCRRSQSVGKLLLGLRIVTVRDGSPGGPLRAYLLRGVLTWVLVWMTGIIGLSYMLVDSFVIFREDQRCLHDLIAGTKVVRIK